MSATGTTPARVSHVARHALAALRLSLPPRCHQVLADAGLLRPRCAQGPRCSRLPALPDHLRVTAPRRGRLPVDPPRVEPARARERCGFPVNTGTAAPCALTPMHSAQQAQ
jgi:hypothetical protein